MPRRLAAAPRRRRAASPLHRAPQPRFPGPVCLPACPPARLLPRRPQVRLVRERFMLLKSCVMAGKDDAKVPYLYHLGGGAAAAAAAAPHH